MHECTPAMVNERLMVLFGPERDEIRRGRLRIAAIQASSGTTHKGGSPRATRCTLSQALRKRATWLSQVGPAKCAVSTTLSRLNKGLLEGGGARWTRPTT